MPSIKYHENRHVNLPSFIPRWIFFIILAILFLCASHCAHRNTQIQNLLVLFQKQSNQQSQHIQLDSNIVLTWKHLQGVITVSSSLILGCVITDEG